MVSSDDFRKAVELIGKSTNVLVTTHTKPDGDACGCVVAVCDVLSGLGKKVGTVFLSEIPEWYEFLFEEKPPILGEDVKIEQFKQAGYDLIVLVDVNSDNQLPGFCDYLKPSDVPVMVIDHHETGDGLGDVELVDSSAAATALIVLDLFKYAGWPVSEKIATALFVAIATDTGWFRFRNTDELVFSACSELIKAGASPPQVYQKLYLNFSLQRFRLMTAAANTLELYLDGRFATQQLSQADFARSGAAYKDTENLIDECRRIKGVEAAGLFIELADGDVRCSLRSSGAVDVARVAQKFGGGGHRAAAGATLDGPLDSAKRLVFEQIAEQFAEIDGK